jgi:hypothetical protein
MLYVPSADWCGTFKKAEVLMHQPPQNYMGGTWTPDPVEESRGWLTAIDASTGAIRWRYESRRPMLAAVTATSADLLFTGELEGDFLVLDARDGAVLYRFNTGGAMNGGVVTYQVGGKQHVAVTSGSATRFWRTPLGSATVIIFAVPDAAASLSRSADLRSARRRSTVPRRRSAWPAESLTFSNADIGPGDRVQPGPRSYEKLVRGRSWIATSPSSTSVRGAS